MMMDRDGGPIDARLDAYLADMRKALTKLEDILRALAYEEDFDEREGLARVGMDIVYDARSEMEKMKRMIR